MVQMNKCDKNYDKFFAMINLIVKVTLKWKAMFHCQKEGNGFGIGNLGINFTLPAQRQKDHKKKT